MYNSSQLNIFQMAGPVATKIGGFLFFITLVAFAVFMYLMNDGSCLIFNNCGTQEVVFKTSKVYFNKDGTEIPLNVEVASSAEQIKQGLMNRNYLGEDWGMLFIFSNEDKHSFWMKNTLIALDMIYVNADSVIVDIKENVSICSSGDSCPTYKPIKDCLYVIEVNAGWVEEHDITIGNTFVIERDSL